MPYVSIKAYPKDEKVKQQLVEKINNVFLEVWGCPQEAISISFEDVAPDDWNSKVREPEILQNSDKMMILEGKKSY